MEFMVISERIFLPSERVHYIVENTQAIKVEKYCHVIRSYTEKRLLLQLVFITIAKWWL